MAINFDEYEYFNNSSTSNKTSNNQKDTGKKSDPFDWDNIVHLSELDDIKLKEKLSQPVKLDMSKVFPAPGGGKYVDNKFVNLGTTLTTTPENPTVPSTIPHGYVPYGDTKPLRDDPISAPDVKPSKTLSDFEKIVKAPLSEKTKLINTEFDFKPTEISVDIPDYTVYDFAKERGVSNPTDNKVKTGEKITQFLRNVEIPKSITPKTVYQWKKETQIYPTKEILDEPINPIKITAVAESKNYWYYKNPDGSLSSVPKKYADEKLPSQLEWKTAKQGFDQYANPEAQVSRMSGPEKFIRRFQEAGTSVMGGANPSGIETGNPIADKAADVLGTVGGFLSPNPSIPGSSSIGGASEMIGSAIENTIAPKIVSSSLPNIVKNAAYKGIQNAATFGAMGAIDSGLRNESLPETAKNIGTNMLVGGASGLLSKFLPKKVTDAMEKNVIGRSVLRGLPGATAFAGLGAVEGIEQGENPAQVLSRIFEGVITGYLLDNALYGAGKYSREFSKKIDESVTGVKLKYDAIKNRNVKDIVPIKDTIVRNPNHNYEKEGYTEFRPGSGIWIKYDPKTGHQVDVAYEMVVHNGEVVPLYKLKAYTRQATKTANEPTKKSSEPAVKENKTVSPEEKPINKTPETGFDDITIAKAKELFDKNGSISVNDIQKIFKIGYGPAFRLKNIIESQYKKPVEEKAPQPEQPSQKVADIKPETKVPSLNAGDKVTLKGIGEVTVDKIDEKEATITRANGKKMTFGIKTFNRLIIPSEASSKINESKPIEPEVIEVITEAQTVNNVQPDLGEQSKSEEIKPVQQTTSPDKGITNQPSALGIGSKLSLYNFMGKPHQTIEIVDDAKGLWKIKLQNGNTLSLGKKVLEQFMKKPEAVEQQKVEVPQPTEKSSIAKVEVPSEVKDEALSNNQKPKEDTSDNKVIPPNTSRFSDDIVNKALELLKKNNEFTYEMAKKDLKLNFNAAEELTKYINSTYGDLYKKSPEVDESVKNINKESAKNKDVVDYTKGLPEIEATKISTWHNKNGTYDDKVFELSISGDSLKINYADGEYPEGRNWGKTNKIEYYIQHGYVVDKKGRVNLIGNIEDIIKSGQFRSISGPGTYEIRKEINSSGYTWDSAKKMYINKRYNSEVDKPSEGTVDTKNPDLSGAKSNDNIKEEPKTDTTEKTAHAQIAEQVQKTLESGEKLSSAQLFKISMDAYKGSQAEGTFSPKDAYDAMELGVNKYLESQNKIDLKSRDLETVKENVAELSKIMDNLPTQTKRTEEMVEFQQFSTPPPIAYVASWAANISSKDVVLEPSAGIGGLATFAKINGAKVVVNELSKRRLEVLKEMGFDRYFNENAEQINNILPKDIKPTVVIMNPPFSSTAGRMAGKTNTKNATLHVEQALKRLKSNGRLVAIVGRGMADNTPMFRDWWSKIKKEYNVRANIGINGKNYTKYGTSFDIQIFVIDKNGATTASSNTITGSVDNLADAIDKLEAIANDRAEITTRADKENQPIATKSSGKEVSDESKTESRSDTDLPSTISGMGAVESGRNGGRSGIDKTGNAEPSRETKRDGKPEPGDGNSIENTLSDRTGEGLNKDKETGGSSGVSDRRTEVGTDGRKPAVSGVKVERKTAEERKIKKKDLGNSVYADYTPQKLKIKGAKPHLGPLAQSAAMAAVEPPEPTYTPNLPKEVIEEGKLSIAQLEAVVYAGQAHQQILPSGERKGFFIGDGTGVGKGREISGIILDNLRQGKKKAVWISKNEALFEDAQRDFGGIGGDPNIIINFSKIKLGSPIPKNEGILFVTYGTLGQNLSYTDAGNIRTKEGKQSRLDQIVNWLGKDFDGVIAFDEAHLMQNSIQQKGKRGVRKPSIRAIAGIELQKKMPNAKVVYVSATGATEVSNLAYAERLGLWGEGTSFANKNDFISKIHDGGLAAMELVARDMKAMGVYIARTLSFDGIQYDTIEHELTPEQTEIFDKMAEGWQIVLQNLDKALDITGQNKDGNAHGRAISQFWSSQQRFFNQILTSMQMPSVIQSVKKDIAEGNAVVMQLVNTNEASQNRAISKLEEEDGSLDDLDLTPRDMLLQYIDKSFPVQQFEDYIDDNGNERSRPVYDSHGNMVINQEAQEMKEELIAKLGAMKVPEGPLEIVLNTFGVENVSEITGRTRRVVRVKDEHTGKYKAKMENRTSRNIAADVDAFMEDKKRILVFSEAGGTGKSYHADLTKKNQRQRIHYLIQAGWRADAAVQGFGRTHRTNQASAPKYVLVTTNLKGQKRFISSIARRLDQLGALTKGQRDTGSQGLFSAKDNLESSIARDALQRFYKDLATGGIEGLDKKTVLRQMGLEKKLLDEYGQLNDDAETQRDITKFLNRILSLDSALQNKVFDAFSNRLETMVEIAKKNGSLDVGLENFKADMVEIVDEKVIRQDKLSGAETKYIQLKASYKVKKLSLDDIKKTDRKLVGFYKNSKSGNIKAVFEGGNKTLENGNVVETFGMQGISRKDYTRMDKEQFKKSNWEKVDASEVEKLWNEAYEKTPEYDSQTVYLISGALLPIWDRLPTGHVRVMRVLTDDGQQLLGRLISERDIDYTLRRLGAERKKEKVNFPEVIRKIIEDNNTVYLSNDWRLVKRKVSGEYRIEIMGDDLYRNMKQLKNEGVITEIISYQTRFFIPTGENAVGVLERVTKYRPIVEVVPPEEFDSLRQAEKELGKSIDETLTSDKEFMGAGWVPPWAKIGKAGTGKVGGKDTAIDEIDYEGFSDAESERRWQEAKNHADHSIKKQISRLNELRSTLKSHFMHGAFEHLPRGREFAELRHKLLVFSKGKDIALYRTLKNIQGIVIDMTPKQYDLFERKVALDDMAEELKTGHELAFGFTPESVKNELDIVNNAIENDEVINNALNKRRKLWNAIKKEYINEMKAIGFNVENRFNRENYYRHLILDFVNTDRVVTGTGKRLKTPTGAGYLKQRQGSVKDYVSEYIQAESEVMAQMLYDIERAKIIGYVENSNHNIIKKLRSRAKAENKSLVNEIIASEKADPRNNLKDKDGNTLSPTEVALKSLDKKIAMSFSKLNKMAAQNILWDGDNHQYKDVVNSLSSDNLDIEDDVNRLYKYLGELAGKDIDGSIPAATILKYTSRKRQYIKELLGNKYVTWEKIIPEGYEVWQARPGQAMYMTYSIPEQVAEKLVENTIESIGVSKNDLKRVLAVGMPYREMVIKSEVAATLDNLFVGRNDKGIEKLVRFTTGKWKAWQLISPGRLVKYNIRNLTGDADHIFVGNPRVFSKSIQATKELFDVMFMNKGMTDNLRDWFERGGLSTLQQVQEMGDINSLKMFLHLHEKKGSIKQLPTKVWQTYWKTARLSTDFREAILRYAAYLEYYEELEVGKGIPKNFGASIPEEVMALSDNKDKAFKLSNELCGAYDDVSIAGQYISERWIPFYRWMEVNPTIYFRIFKNAARNNNFAATVGRAAVVGARKASFWTLVQIGKVVIMALAFSALCQAWNMIFFSDEEQHLPANVRNRPHIIFGRDSDGNILYFSRLGSLGDLLDWFGLGTPVQDVSDILNGKKTIKEQAVDMAKAPANKLAGAAIPFEKLALETLSGQSYFPDVTKPSVIRDKAEYIANSLGIADEYKALAGKPSKGYLNSLISKFIYKSDPNESAYYEILEAKRRFLKDYGKESISTFWTDAKSLALYNYKMSLKYGDKEAADKYLTQYAELGGTSKGLKQSLQSMSPVYGLPKGLRDEFYDYLDSEEKSKLELAIQFYADVLNNNGEVTSNDEAISNE